MANRKSSSLKKGALEGFRAVDAVPPAIRSSWATNALDEFLEGNDAIVACTYDTQGAAVSKQASLNKAAKLDLYAGKVAIHRRKNTIYIEKL